MAVTFSKATKRQSKLRLALIGPSGSGKTYSALAIATGLGGKIALIDTEHGSASKYADLFSFDSLELESFSPDTYIEAIAAAQAAGYDTLIIDSLSHAWAGKGGILEFVDRARDQSGDAFGSGWRKATPKHNALVDAMLGAQLHIIATMRSKTEYLVEQIPGGKTRIRKVGMQPVQRDGMEYEFDLCGDLDQDNTLTVTKSRCPALSGQQIDKPGAQMAGVLRAWLSDGAPVPPPAPKPAQPAPATTAPAAQPAPAPTGLRHPLPAIDANRGVKLTWVMEAFKLLGWNTAHQAGWLKKHFALPTVSGLENGRLAEAMQMLYIEINPPVVTPAAATGTWEDIVSGPAAEAPQEAGK